MDKAIPSNGHIMPGISIRNGPMEDADHPMSDVNGVETNGSTSKRKSRGSLAKPPYTEANSSDEDDMPLVGLSYTRSAHLEFYVVMSASANHVTDSCLDQATTNYCSQSRICRRI